MDIQINHKHFLTGKQCFIKYKQRSSECNKTFYDHNPFFSNESVLAETVSYILDELRTTLSFKSVVLKTGISQKKVVQIFDKYVDIAREPIPKILGIDEFHYKSTGYEKYTCILIDNTSENPTIVDIIKDRKKILYHIIFNILI